MATTSQKACRPFLDSRKEPIAVQLGLNHHPGNLGAQAPR